MPFRAAIVSRIRTGVVAPSCRPPDLCQNVCQNLEIAVTLVPVSFSTVLGADLRRGSAARGILPALADNPSSSIP